MNAKFNDAYAKKDVEKQISERKAYYEYAKSKGRERKQRGIGDTVWEDLLKECNVKKYPAGSENRHTKTRNVRIRSLPK